MTERNDRPSMLGETGRRFLQRDEERSDRPSILGSTQDRRARRAETMARRGETQLADLPKATASGAEVFNVSEAGQSVSVLFAQGFTEPPRVVVSSNSGLVRVWATAVTITGFTLQARRVEGSGTFELEATWLAVARQGDTS